MKKLFSYKVFVLLHLLFLMSSQIQSQINNLIVDHLTLKDGLPSEIINCIYQDSYGFIWIGTSNGLVKYDGYEMTLVKPYSLDTLSFIDNWIHSIAEDKNGNLWTAGNVLSRYSRNNNTFINFNYENVIPFPFVDVNVEHKSFHFAGFNGPYSKIYIDKKQNLWIGTYSFGLYRLELNEYEKNVNTSTFEIIFHDLGVEGSQSINSVAEDKYGNIWIATNNGLVRLLSENSKIKIYQFEKTTNYNTKNHFTDIVVDDDLLWISTLGHGLYKFSISDGTFKYQSLKSANEPDNYSNSVYTITMDNNQTLWCGMYGDGEYAGIIKFNKYTEEKVRYLNDFRKDYSIGPYGSWINDILIDNSNVIWISYRFGPLDKIIPERNFIKYVAPEDYRFDEIKNPKTYDFQPINNSEVLLLTSGGILSFNAQTGSLKQEYLQLKKIIQSNLGEKCFLLDSNNNLWIGYDDGIYKYLSTTENTIVINTNNCRKREIIEDKNDIYWIATFGEGLIKYNDQSKRMKYFKYDQRDPKTIRDDYLNCIYLDNDNGIWLGTNGGWITRFDKGTETAENFHSDASVVQRIGKYTEDEIWIATAKGGFQLINKITKTKRIYTSNLGLPQGFVNGAVEDTSGSFWIITNNAVTKFNPGQRLLHNFYAENNINWFWDYYNYDTNNDIIYIAGNKGFFYFFPHELKLNSIPPQMLFTDVKIFNESILNNKDSLFTKSIEFSDVLILPHDKNDFTFEFSALHYVEPQKNQYKYILKNYDNDWRNVGYERTARYTSLPHGEYIFKVLGSNSDGVWATEPATLSITILPPWWETWWAYLLYALVFISLLAYGYLLQRRRLKFRHEFEMKEFEAAKLKEVDQLKSSFFANISHEFRTPLTLIKGPVEQLLDGKKLEDPNKTFRMIKRNSERLLNLINELLDLSKLESGKMKLSAQKADIVSFSKSIAMSFESLAERKKIQVNFRSSNEMIEVYFDKEKLQKIITNLLSNAFKFTNELGKIDVYIELDESNNSVDLKIKDDGIGIPKEDLPKIFDRFFQVSNNDQTDNIGTGIGLSLTKELVEMHHGEISVTSEPGNGSEFIVSLHLGREHLQDEDLIYIDEGETTEQIESYEEEVIANEEDSQSKAVVLVVEDNKDVRDFITDILKTDFEIKEAEDGEEGLKKAIECMPDIIISDIMMPKMSGDIMCGRLKKDQITSHIPIILLTAKASDKDKINGLETGADDYLIKPFNEKELRARINNLIAQRKKLREKYLREAEIHPAEVAVTSYDKKFIERAISIVEENISNSNFSTEQLASELLLSRVQLYRKFKSILGEKPNEFIRKYRIKRAAELIKQNYGNITQIAYEVGFSDPAYFSKCFKKVYNVTPIVYEKDTKS